MKRIFLSLFILILIIFSFYLFKNKKLDLRKINQVLKNEKNLLLNKENIYHKERSSQNVYQSISQDLNLEIVQPKNNTTINLRNLKIKGKTNPNVEVFVNEKQLKSNEKGDFEADLILDEGENIITIVASDEQANYNEREIVVNFEPLINSTF